MTDCKVELSSPLAHLKSTGVHSDVQCATFREVNQESLLESRGPIATRYWWMTLALWAISGAYVISPVFTDRDVEIRCHQPLEGEVCNIEYVCANPDVEWEYVNARHSTLSTFDLVCSRRWLQSILGSIFFMGWFFGVGVCGFASDAIGRRKTYLVAVYTMFFVLLGSSLFTVNVPLLLTFRLLMGALSGGLAVVSYVAASEYMPADLRAKIATRSNLLFAFGAALLPALSASVDGDWRSIMLITAILWVVIVTVGGVWVQRSLSPLRMTVSAQDVEKNTQEEDIDQSHPQQATDGWWGVESIRWLISQDRIQEAKEIMWRLSKKQYGNDEIEVYVVTAKQSTVSGQSAKMSIKDLLTHGTLRPLLFMNAFMWFVASLSYYGLSLNAGHFGVSLNVGVILGSLVEIPGMIICEYLLDKWGRRPTTVAYFHLTGICCVGYVFVPESMTALSVTLAMVGKFGISAAFAAIYVYSLELFPTPVRNLSIGLCSQAAVLGGMLAPMLITLGKQYGQIVTMLSFGIAAVLSGICAQQLPETLGLPLRETLEDVVAGSLRHKALPLPTDDMDCGKELSVFDTSCRIGSADALVVLENIEDDVINCDVPPSHVMIVQPIALHDH